MCIRDRARIAALRKQTVPKNIVFGTVISDLGVADLADDLFPHDLKDDMVQAAKEYSKAVEAMEFAAVPKAKAAGAKKKKKKRREGSSRA